MATGIYRGVNNVARKVTKMYRGVSNVARKVTKGYRGVSNVARLFYASQTTKTQTGSKTWNTIAWGYIVYFTFDFPIPYVETPTVHISGSGAEKGFDKLEVTSVGLNSFSGRFEPGGTPGQEYDNITITWQATGLVEG